MMTAQKKEKRKEKKTKQKKKNIVCVLNLGHGG